jgi:hypothetical protein
MKRRTFRVVLSAIGLACSLLLLAATSPLHAESASTSLATAYNNRSDPTRLIASYYDAINSGDFARAYEYWESAPNGASLEQFARGFINTKSVQFSLTPPTSTQGAAGSVYAELPTVILGTQIDGSIRTFTGCYVARRSNIENTGWRIYSAKVEEAASSATAASVIQRAAALCPS